MSTDRPTRDSMSLEEATISNMWEIAASIEVLERKGICTKQEVLELTAHQANSHFILVWCRLFCPQARIGPDQQLRVFSLGGRLVAQQGSDEGR